MAADAPARLAHASARRDGPAEAGDTGGRARRGREVRATARRGRNRRGDLPAMSVPSRSTIHGGRLAALLGGPMPRALLFLALVAAASLLGACGDVLVRALEPVDPSGSGGEAGASASSEGGHGGGTEGSGGDGEGGASPSGGGGTDEGSGGS